MISSSEKDTSLKPEALWAWDQKSQVWNVMGQKTVGIFWRVIFELKSHCKEENKGNCIVLISTSHPASEHLCCCSCTADLY